MSMQLLFCSGAFLPGIARGGGLRPAPPAGAGCPRRPRARAGPPMDAETTRPGAGPPMDVETTSPEAKARSANRVQDGGAADGRGDDEARGQGQTSQSSAGEATAPSMEVECIVDDKRPAFVPCLSDCCPYMAHPRPSEHDIEPGYCCNRCYGRSTNQPWARRKGCLHYKNCFGKMAEHPKMVTTKAAAPRRGRRNRRRGSEAGAEAARGAPVEPESGTDDCMEGLVTEELHVFCPRCNEEMIWSTNADGMYGDGWRCNNYDKCGVQSDRSNYDMPNQPRYFCSECECDLCGACAHGLHRTN